MRYVAETVHDFTRIREITAVVVDTTRNQESIVGGYAIAGCEDMETAQKIADALNARAME